MFFPGNIIYLNVMGNEMIVLNCVDDARELLDRRGALYSSRPRSVFAGEMSVSSLFNDTLRFTSTIFIFQDWMEIWNNPPSLRRSSSSSAPNDATGLQLSRC